MSADIIVVPTSSSAKTQPIREELSAGAVLGGGVSSGGPSDLHLAIMRREKSWLEKKKSVILVINLKKSTTMRFRTLHFFYVLYLICIDISMFSFIWFVIISGSYWLHPDNTVVVEWLCFCELQVKNLVKMIGHHFQVSWKYHTDNSLKCKGECIKCFRVHYHPS